MPMHPDDDEGSPAITNWTGEQFEAQLAAQQEEDVEIAAWAKGEGTLPPPPPFFPEPEWKREVQVPDVFTLDDIRWAAAECERQQSGEMSVYKLVYAVNTMRRASWAGAPLMLDHARLQQLAQIIEPRTAGEYRTTFVSKSGEMRIIGVNPMQITGALETLISIWNDPTSDMTLDEVTFEFLKVHPFIDGNGRTAAVLYNWLGETLYDLKPLPEYDFSQERLPQP